MDRGVYDPHVGELRTGSPAHRRHKNTSTMKRYQSIKRYKAPPLADDAAMPHDDVLKAAVPGALLLDLQTIADVRQVLTRKETLRIVFIAES